MATLTFLGATGTVTGSRYLLEAGGERLMVDCGLFQGEKALRERNWRPLPIPAASVRWLLLTHAHIDHTGYIPRFVQDGFQGLVFASAATVDLAHLLLPDAGHLQEEDAGYANRKGFSKHQPALPLFTYQDAIDALQQFQAMDESKPLELSSHFSVRTYAGGHILGARMLEVTVKENGVARKVLFSGDVGRPHQLILREPAIPEPPDYFLLESTYGDRLHPSDDVRSRLASLLAATADKHGRLVVPAFAVGRTQELLYLLRELAAQGRMPNLPIHVDSPMAIDATDLYRRHHEDHNLEMDRLEAGGIRPFSPPGLHLDRTVDESKALNDASGPLMIISASGMATGGRVLHHLERALPDSRNTILFVGFQAAGTRGQFLESGAASVKMHGGEVPVRARIESLGSLSGHADYGEMLRWLARFPKPPAKTFLVHGEPAGAGSMRDKIRQQLGWEVTVPAFNETIAL